MADVTSDPHAPRWHVARGLVTAVTTNLLLAILVTVVGGVTTVEFVVALLVSLVAGVRAARPDPVVSAARG